MQSWILDESPGRYRWGDIAPPPVGADDVLIRVVASALNHMDLWVTRDLSELLPDMVPALQSQVRHVGGAGHARRLAFHPPCTLQHGQQLRGGVETHLRALGFEVSLAGSESHLCCGSAGTYSVLQPTLAYQLRDRKLGHLSALEPQAIVSANIGCIQHLQSGTGTPVRHWVEVLDDALAAAA